MSRKIIIVLILFISVSSFAQKQKATLYFRDGTSQTGLIEIIKGDKIRFKESKKSELKIYNAQTVKKLIIHNINRDVEYFYKIVMNGKYTRPYLLEIVEEGFLTLYKDTQKIYSGGSPGGFMTTGGGPAPISTTYIPGSPWQSDTIDIFYVNESGSDFVNHLSTPNINHKKERKRKLQLENFKNDTSEYFKYCPELIEKIDNYEYTNQQDIIKIIKFYNENCGIIKEEDSSKKNNSDTGFTKQLNIKKE